MNRFVLPASLALLCAALPAWAQAPAPPARPVTVWTEIDQPMSALLNGGHRIVAAMGPSFTLEKGGKYVVCEIRPAGGMSSRRETTSECHGVN
ncbi:hypothetical protein [Roseomonas haemaphysalidis]|uniref:Uncharacterized protein n=1 Tax=Roseomonas haemaphysalidis TaxID=2768162 RepID=A0ABS3KUR1_9PROT|nr:hypothetical protein [Roseomonas haemaphysalidis]MBO1081222.1 hypothetical protein [Roseomonas haemaphysalidis]